MPVYMIANVKVTDESWIPSYAENVHGLVHKHGGKYLSRSPNITPIEGDAPDTTVVAIIEFPSQEAVQEFFSDPEYIPYAKARQEGTISKLFVVDDTDIAGTIPYLRKA
ncbi:MAG: DUF1330 domain-containing protein [Puniceicoccaceae bacterium]